MKTKDRPNGAEKSAKFVSRAERAFGRVARKLRADDRKLRLPPVVWPNGKLQRTSSSGRSFNEG